MQDMLNVKANWGKYSPMSFKKVYVTQFFQRLQQNNAASSHHSTAKASVISVGLSVTEVRLDEIDGTQLV